MSRVAPRFILGQLAKPVDRMLAQQALSVTPAIEAEGEGAPR